MKTSLITIRYALTLGTIALFCTAISTAVFWLTKDRIDLVTAEQQRELLHEVVPQNYFDNDLLGSCKEINLPEAKSLNKLFFAKKQDNLTAYAIQATAPDGYSGDIVLLIGIQPDGKVLDVRTLAHKETPGLGDKIEKRVSNWIDSFANKEFNLDNETQWAVKKDGGQFDQFTGATITPRAVVNTVRQSAKWIVTTLRQHPQYIEEFSNCK